MTELGLRLQMVREDLQLSREYVAKQMNIDGSSLSQLESGDREASAEELIKLSELYQLPVEKLVFGRAGTAEPAQVFTRRFDKLDEVDHQEVWNLMEFKRMLKEQNQA